MNNEIGVLINYKTDTNVEAEFQKALDIGITSCQLCVWDDAIYTDAYAKAVSAALKKTGFKITALWAGWPGPREWNFTYGPATIGLVPAAYRDERLKVLKKAADFAEQIGTDKIVTHVGFIPENPDHPDFAGTVGALRDLCKYLKKKGQYFLFETGQETPVTMLRTIQAIGMENVGINFDTANLILYGKANTLDALDVFGKYVMQTHIKDGLYPTDGMSLGEQLPLGEGRANVPAVLKKLNGLGYQNALTIEREIKGEQQIKDIIKAKELLAQWMREV